MKINHDILGHESETWSKFVLAVLVLFGCVALVYGSIYIVGEIFLGITNSANTSIFSEFSNFGDDSAGFIFMMMCSIAAFHPAIALMTRFGYHRKYLSYINPMGFAIRPDIKFALIFIAIYFGLSELIGALLTVGSYHFEYTWEIGTWLIWIIPMAIAILLQTSAEEFLFRGFLQQYLRGLTANRAVYILLPAMLWSLLHIGNIEGKYTDLAAVFSVIVMGLIFGDWADRSRSLIGPLTVHFLNNFILICLIGSSLEPSELHIFRSVIDNVADEKLGVIFFMSSLMMGGVYLYIRKFIPDRREAL